MSAPVAPVTFSAGEGWAVELRGEALDLDDLRDALVPPFSPWVEDYESDGQVMLLLRSAKWRSLESGHAVSADARRLIDQINAAQVLAHVDARKVVLGVALRFDAAGQRLPVIVAGSMEMTLGSARCRARASVGAGVTMMLPSPSAMQQRLGRAERDEAAADLLGFVARADNWFDLFKAMETVERLVGDARAVQQHDRAWKRVRQAANRHRHAPSPKYPPPNPPVDFDEARAVLLRVAAAVL